MVVAHVINVSDPVQKIGFFGLCLDLGSGLRTCWNGGLDLGFTIILYHPLPAIDVKDQVFSTDKQPLPLLELLTE